jgi:hypothetical protein
MCITQSIGRVGAVLGIVLALGALRACTFTLSPTKAAGDTPLCGDSPKAVHHYECGEGYSMGYGTYGRDSSESAK